MVELSERRLRIRFMSRLYSRHAIEYAKQSFDLIALKAHIG